MRKISINKEQLTLINGGVKISIISSILLYSVCLYVLFLEGFNLVPFLLVGVLGLFVRGIALYLQVDDKREIGLRQWKRVHFLNVFSLAIFYALMAVSIYWYEEMIHQLVVYVIIAGVSAGATTSYSSVKFLANLFIFVVLVPLIIVGFIKNEEGAYLLAFTTALFLFFMNRITEEGNSKFLQSVQQKSKISDLEEAQEKIDKYQQLRNEFFASISHEIRTPLNGIFGLIDLLNETELDEEQEDYVVTLKQSSWDLLRVVNDVLDLSKIQSGSFELVEEQINVEELVHKCVSLFKGRANQKNLTIKVNNTLPKDSEICIDGTRLSQVLNNLISNAVKYSEEGVIQIDIIQKEQLEISVKDSGIGLSKEKQEHLFERYHQIFEDNKVKTEVTEKGTGLGLSICKEILGLMGGEITLFSREGLGSKFTIHLPVKVVSSQVNKGIEDEVVNTLFDKKILLVDDKFINLKVTGLMLEKLGCEVITASNGEEALNLVMSVEHDFDLILMDIQMPVMDGIEATKRIKELDLKDTQVYALSAQLEGNLENDIDTYGFDGYLTKPVNKEMIVKVLSIL